MALLRNGVDLLAPDWLLIEVASVLRKQWRWNAIDPEQIKLTRPDLDVLLWGRRGLSRTDQKSLLGMMQTSGICFVHCYGGPNEETEYVAPDLLPESPEVLDDELAARWDPTPDEPLEAAFVYPFLSPAIARLLLSEFGRLAGATALYWRYGLCLYDKETRATAIVEERPDAEGYGGQIRLRAKGAGAADSVGAAGRMDQGPRRGFELIRPIAGAAPGDRNQSGPGADPAGHCA